MVTGRKGASVSMVTLGRIDNKVQDLSLRGFSLEIPWKKGTKARVGGLYSWRICIAGRVGNLSRAVVWSIIISGLILQGGSGEILMA